jgi:F-type H+-transporting ATPase subunit alpha
LQNFARLGVELDPAAQAQLDRGSRMVELLKQLQFAPMSIGEQVITIFAGSSGLLDDVPIGAVAAFMGDFLKSLAQDNPEYIGQINKTGKLPDELAEKITVAIKNLKSTHDFAVSKEGVE